MLNREWMNAAIVTSNFESAMADTNASDKVNIGQEPFNADEVLIFVFVLQVLAGDLDLIKLLETKFAKMRAI